MGDDQNRLKAKSALPPPTARKRGGNEPEGGCTFFRRLRVPGKGNCGRSAKMVDVVDDCGTCEHRQTADAKVERNEGSRKSIVALLEQTSDSKHARDGESWFDLISRLREARDGAALGAVLTILQRQGVGSSSEILGVVDSSGSFDPKPTSDVPLKPRRKVRPRVVGEGRADQFEARLSNPNPVDPWESRASSLLRGVPSGNHQTVRQYIAGRLQDTPIRKRISFLQRQIDSSNLLPDNVEEAKMELMSELPEDFEWGSEQDDESLGLVVTDIGDRSIPLTEDVIRASERDIYGQRARDVLEGVPNEFNGTVREYLVKIATDSDGPIDAGIRLEEIMRANSALPYDLDEVQQAITPALPEGWSWDNEYEQDEDTQIEEEDTMPDRENAMPDPEDNAGQQEPDRPWRTGEGRRTEFDLSFPARKVYFSFRKDLTAKGVPEPSDSVTLIDWLCFVYDSEEGMDLGWKGVVADVIGTNTDTLNRWVDRHSADPDPAPDDDPGETHEDPPPADPISAEPEPKPDDDHDLEPPPRPGTVDLGDSDPAQALAMIFSAVESSEQLELLCGQMLDAVSPYPVPAMVNDPLDDDMGVSDLNPRIVAAFLVERGLTDDLLDFATTRGPEVIIGAMLRLFSEYEERDLHGDEISLMHLTRFGPDGPHRADPDSE